MHVGKEHTWNQRDHNTVCQFVVMTLYIVLNSLFAHLFIQQILLSTYCVPGTVPGLLNLIFRTVLQGRYYYPHFREEETEA